MGKPGPMQTPITARIKRTTQGGMTTQPILNMGAPVKMKRTPAKKSLVGNQDQLPANLQADIKAAPGKMYKSPARVDKAAEAKRKKAISKGLDDQKVEGYLNDSAFNDSNMDGTMASRAIKGLYRAGKKAAMRATGGPAGGAMAEAEGIKNRKDDNNDYNNSHYIKFKGDNPDLFKSGGGAEDPVKVDPVKVDPKKTTKSYVKKGGTATGNMKDYKIGSQKRRDEYTARGWKQDKTTAVKGGAKRKKVKKVSTLTSRPIVTKKVEITTKLDPTKKPKITSAPKETSKRASKLRAKGNAQLAAGDNKGALATRRKYDKKNKKVASKTKKGTNRVEYDESTGKGGSVLGNALRTVTGKRKRDKAAAERRKNAPGGNMI
jgi:hypothetical protein